MAQQPIIQTENLTKIYGVGEIAVTALGGVDIHISPGEFVAVMGPSGSGKSTLMNILGCLDRPTEGCYILDGKDVSGLDKKQLADIRSQKLGFIFQSYNLLSRTTALKNVMLPLLYNRENKHDPQEREEIALAALESVGLADRVHHRPNELSGGQRQRGPSPAPWSTTRCSSWPTSRPATWIPAPATRSWTFCTNCTTEAAPSSWSPTRRTSPPTPNGSSASAMG